MLHTKYILNFILIHFIVADPHINLHHTNFINENQVDNTLQHDCLRVTPYNDEIKLVREIISYCMSELPSHFHNTTNNLFPKFTFHELAKQNISSKQLYFWSASMELAERYQFYLNQLSTSNDTSLETQVFYNCTLPRFGSRCQYEFIVYHQNHSSLYEIIDDYYTRYEYNPTNFTCYTHLKCNRGPLPACLAWSEICDGQVDCLDGGYDEEHCWQLEINSCNANEYQCANGQCIPQEFFRDDYTIPDCLDSSDEFDFFIQQMQKCKIHQPSFVCEERTCRKLFVTNSCQANREELLVETIFSTETNVISQECWSALKCVLHLPAVNYSFCSESCTGQKCSDIINSTCPDMFYIRNAPLVFGHIYIAYTKTDLMITPNGYESPCYVCYNNSDYDEHFINQSIILFSSSKCYRYFLLPSFGMPGILQYYMYINRLAILFNDIKKYNIITIYNTAVCNDSKSYHCVNSSKCISLNRIMNSIPDCPKGDDENITHIKNIDFITLLKRHFRCELSNKYIHQKYVLNNICDCPTGDPLWCEDESFNRIPTRKKISFQITCDGFREMFPVMIDKRNETDETECQQWACNNVYTHCDGVWNCPKGEDEIGCHFYLTFNCSSNHHICVSPHTNQLICLPIVKANDGKIDCLGGTDEPRLCLEVDDMRTYYSFFCRNDRYYPCLSNSFLCDSKEDCENGEDEQFCLKNRSNLVESSSICFSDYSSVLSDVEQFLCHETKPKQKLQVNYFTLNSINKFIEDDTTNIEKSISSISSIIKISHQYEYQCHRGFSVRIWLNDEKNSTRNTCFCPPSFYGDQCQYENQRISLTVQFQAFSDSWSTLFAIIISLIDDSEERIIHSYEQFTYLSIRDCKVKFNVYLLYSTRPKDQTKNYSIHIDIYEKISLNYRGSLLVPVQFPFLPVQRLAYLFNIPQIVEKPVICSKSQCVHGKCIIYSNSLQTTNFCQCYQGWSGRHCTYLHNHSCSQDSISIGVSAYNRSVCVCPIHKFGYQCLLTHTICQTDKNSTCQNSGQCIPADEYMTSNEKFHCICPKGYTGDRCKIVDRKIVFKFANSIALSQSVFIHFIEIIYNALPRRMTSLRAMPIIKKPLIIYWSQPFHLIFVELYNKIYYLAFIEKTYNRSTDTAIMINPSDRCQHIDELFNATFTKMHIVRRIKYYHLPCQRNSSNLRCFYDDIHICLCYDFEQQRLANCFEFNHTMKFDCLGRSVCKSGGQCFQDSPTCPRRSICMCSPCFYGAHCQFSSSSFGLSLDAILGYHIQPNLTINYQPNIVKVSVVLTIIFIIAGSIDGILSLLTFKNKIIRNVGCGLYLLGSSVTTVLTTIIFALKFWILVLAQMGVISNRIVLQMQCLSLDFLIRVCLNMDQWFNACVGIERTVTIIQAAKFKKAKSKEIAKKAIVILLLFTIGTNIYDPFYRRLIDEENEDDKRLWCIAIYTSKLQIFNSILQTFHFLAPFLINIISSVILIAKISRRHSNIHTNQDYRTILKREIRQHKHLFTAPVVLVILGIPRLTLSFVSQCMKSTNDAWLFLTGYFIAFIPPMLTFVMFILPSKFYKKQLYQSINTYGVNLLRYLQQIIHNEFDFF